MITSKDNQKVKNVIALQKHAKTRKEQKAYVVEGKKMFEELPREDLKEVYVTAEYESKDLKVLTDVNYEVVEDRLFNQMSDTKTPQGILCVVKQKEYELEELLAKPKPMLLILEDLQDPGNVGTILRTAEAAGVDGIILSGGCVDIYNPKTVRGTMGSIYRQPFLYVSHMPDIIKKLKDKKIPIYAAHLVGKMRYDEADYKVGGAFLIGNEGAGLSAKLTEAADKLIKIPMEGQVESLNAASAATILMYEANRQRRRDT